VHPSHLFRSKWLQVFYSGPCHHRLIVSSAQNNNLKAVRATAAILEALNADQTGRVVVIAHSQGTIIMANVLRAESRSRQAMDIVLEAATQRF